MRRNFLLIVVVIGVLLGVGWGLYQYQFHHAYRELDSLEKALAKKIEPEKLKGSPPARVITFLEKKGIPHTEYSDDRSNTPMADLSNTVSASIEKVSGHYYRTAPFDYDLHIVD